jgi:hypothetical protein
MEYGERILGDQSSFWLLKNNTADPQESDWEYMPATLQYHVGNTYVFVDNRNLPTGTVGWPVTAGAKIQALGDAFSSSIYATTRAAFGNEDDELGGVDSDPHIYILLSSLYNNANGGTVGYFWSVNEDTEAEAQQYGDYLGIALHSNAKQIFFVDPENPVEDLKGVLAHEFQHMINFHQRSLARDWDEPTWINEGLAEWTEWRFQGNDEGPPNVRKGLQNAANGGGLPSLVEMSRGMLAAQDNPGLRYALAARTVGLMMKNGGTDNFLGMIKEVGAGQSFGAVLKKRYERDLPRLQEDIESELKSR